MELESQSPQTGRIEPFSEYGGAYREAEFFSLTHAEEVHRESQEINDSVWDCKLIELMKKQGDTVVNPIYHWEDADVWKYLQDNRIETNPLYKCGYYRVGCIGCPLATRRGRLKEFSDYPRFKTCYILAFNRMLTYRKEQGLDTKDWKNGQDVFDWWMEEHYHNVKGQIAMDLTQGGDDAKGLFNNE